MLSKFSVKKPYTVVVAVVLVLILGFVSFGNMTADRTPFSGHQLSLCGSDDHLCGGKSF